MLDADPAAPSDTAEAAPPVTPSTVDPDSLGGRANLHQTPVGTTGRWTLEKLLALTPDEGIALWRTLPAPALAEMDGHYMGLGPHGTDRDYQKGYADYMFNEQSPRGYWLGKAFHPVGDDAGEGYNRWRFPGGKVERNLRMATRVADSIIDGRPCYVLDYSAFYHMTLYDELRRLEHGVYLGTATTEKKEGGRTDLSFFVLVGPTDEWVGGPYGQDLARSKN